MFIFKFNGGHCSWEKCWEYLLEIVIYFEICCHKSLIFKTVEVFYCLLYSFLVYHYPIFLFDEFSVITFSLIGHRIYSHIYNFFHACRLFFQFVKTASFLGHVEGFRLEPIINWFRITKHLSLSNNPVIFFLQCHHLRLCIINFNCQLLNSWIKFSYLL